MYEAFFGFREKPFSLLPDPGFLFLSSPHQNALTLLEYGLCNQAGFIVLTGEIGSGKTTLMRHLLEQLGEDVTVGLISHTHQGLGELIDWIHLALGVPPNGATAFAKHQALIDFLVGQYSQGRRVLVIVDEAQNLGTQRLEELRLLSNINADKDFVLQLMLLGQPELREQLRLPQLAPFVQRVSASYHLTRLDAGDTEKYVKHRIKIAGVDRALFTPDAYHAVYYYTNGIPRVINLICDTALVYAYGAREEYVTGALIDDLVTTHEPHFMMQLDGFAGKEKKHRLPDPKQDRLDVEPRAGTIAVSTNPDGPDLQTLSSEDVAASSASPRGGACHTPTDRLRGAPPSVDAGSVAQPAIARLAGNESSRQEAMASAPTRGTPGRRHGNVVDTNDPVMNGPVTGYSAQAKRVHENVPGASESSTVNSRPRVHPSDRPAATTVLWVGLVLVFVGVTTWMINQLDLMGSTEHAVDGQEIAARSLPQLANGEPGRGSSGEADNAGTVSANDPEDSGSDADSATTGQLDSLTTVVVRDPNDLAPGAADGAGGGASVDSTDAGAGDADERMVSGTAPSAPISEPPGESLAAGEGDGVEPSQAEPLRTETRRAVSAHQDGQPMMAGNSHEAVGLASDVNEQDARTRRGDDVIGRLIPLLRDLELEIERNGAGYLLVNLGPTVRFPDGSTTLDATARQTLGRLAELLRDLDGIQIQVVGHTDSTGSESVNQWLSAERAETVAQFLVLHGLRDDRVGHEGRGYAEPRFDVEQEWIKGPWINRRIEIELRRADRTSH